MLHSLKSEREFLNTCSACENSVSFVVQINGCSIPSFNVKEELDE
jgi:hypothetical protein